MNILDFQISQGSVATHLRWGVNLYNRSVEKFPVESNSERIVKIGVHLPKLWPKNKVADILEHGVVVAVAVVQNGYPPA